jgi:hypothetical protein
MSQPGTATTRIGTRPKNATQHPGHILTTGVGKRRTAAQKAADDQRDREAKEASEKALQESYQRIATLQAQMQANQDAARMDAPKPKRPRPRAHPVGKAAQALKTSNSTKDGGHAGAEIVTNKPIGTKGKGRKCGCEAEANTKHPETDEELEEPVTKTKRKKVSKQVVRDAIQSVLDAGIAIDGSTRPRDGDVQKTTSDV